MATRFTPTWAGRSKATPAAGHAQRAGLNVRDYLTDVLERLADPAFKITQINELLPDTWRAARAATEPTA